MITNCVSLYNRSDSFKVLETRNKKKNHSIGSVPYLWPFKMASPGSASVLIHTLCFWADRNIILISFSVITECFCEDIHFYVRALLLRTYRFLEPNLSSIFHKCGLYWEKKTVWKLNKVTILFNCNFEMYRMITNVKAWQKIFSELWGI